MNWSAAPVDDVPLYVVTVTSTVPAECAGDVAIAAVLPYTATIVAPLVPNETAVVPAKLVPKMVTTVPPEIEPLVGVMLVTVGAAAAL